MELSIDGAMKRFAIIIAALSLAASCAQIIEPELSVADSFLPVAVSVDEALSKASLVGGSGFKDVVWEPSDKFTIYNLTKGTRELVTPSEISEDGRLATIPVRYKESDGEVEILVTFGEVSYADSILLAGAPLKQKLCLDGYDGGAIPMSSLMTKVSLGAEAKISLTPLTALGEMTLTGLPFASEDKIRSINITTEPTKGSRVRYLTGDGCIFKVSDSGFVLDPTSSLTAFKGDYAEYLELCADGLLDYSGSICACFRAAGMVQGGETVDTYFSSVTVTVVTDNHVITKTFDTSSALLRTTLGRISRFTMDMSDAECSERGGFSVVWSPGYLNYDASSKRYGFAAPDDPGLYFKLGSLVGIDPVADVDLSRKLARSRYLVYYKYDTVNGVTVESNYDKSWEEGMAHTLAYHKDESGDIVPWTDIESWDAIDDYVKFSKPEYDPAQDPCSYVNDPDHQWRMPSVAECMEIVGVAAESISNWRVWSRGSDVVSATDSTSHAIGITDRYGNYAAFSSTSYITHSNSISTSGKNAGIQTYYVQLSASYSAYIPTRDFITNVTSKKEEVVGSPVMAITTFNCLRENTETDVRILNSIGSYVHTSSNSQGAAMVRCVRDRD